MGFFQALGNAISSIAQGVVDQGQEVKLIAMTWAFETDIFLAQKCKTGSITEKMAALGILKQKYPDDSERRNIILHATTSA